MSLWSLGQHSGYDGTSLDLRRITCAFCQERGNWELKHRAKKKKPNGDQVLNFDTYKCGNCAGFVMVLWSAGGAGLHGFRALPTPIGYHNYPEHWPDDIGRFWLQAKRNLSEENWDAAAVMAASALQLIPRSSDNDPFDGARRPAG